MIKKTAKLLIIALLLFSALSYEKVLTYFDSSNFLTAMLLERQEDPIQHSDPEVLADLSIEKIDISASKIRVGETLNLTLKIKNSQEIDSPKFKVKLINQASWGLTKQTTVSANLYKYLELNVSAKEVHRGMHKFKIILDSANNVSETNEQNNEYEFDLEVL